MVLDFDHLDPDYAQEFKYFLINEYHFIIATWLSASKCGVRALVNIPQATSVDEFKSYFNGLAHFEMDQYRGFDKAPQNCVLPLFLSYDPDLLCGDTPNIWNKTFTQTKKAAIVQYKYSPNPSRVEKIMKAAIDKIHDNGHPQLRGAAFSLGGYVASGYISEDEANALIYHLIETNAYLNVGKKVDTYKKTALTMIQSGMNKPLFL